MATILVVDSPPAGPENAVFGHRQAWSRLLLKAQEEERRRIARELHDEIGQSLTVVKINLERAISCGAQPPLPLLREIGGVIDGVLDQVRQIALALRPAVLDDLGLVASVRWYLERISGRAGLTATLLAQPPEIRLSPEIETACFRIVQEALTNTVRHAAATRVDVILQLVDHDVELVVRDDGAGFNVAGARRRARRGRSLGLLGIEDRVALLGGRLWIESTRRRGTALRVRLPLAAADSEPLFDLMGNR
jgi:signal transduction histidine kinase